MKSKFKKIFIYALTVFLLCFADTTCFCAVIDDKDTKHANTTQGEIASNISENFNFIKSDEGNYNFLYDGSILLYGGIVLIVISVFGIIITFIPRKKRKKRRKKRPPQRSSQRYVKKRQ